MSTLAALVRDPAKLTHGLTGRTSHVSHDVDYRTPHAPRFMQPEQETSSQ